MDLSITPSLPIYGTLIVHHIPHTIYDICYVTIYDRSYMMYGMVVVYGMTCYDQLLGDVTLRVVMTGYDHYCYVTERKAKGEGKA
jgi:hypothetical protein